MRHRGNNCAWIEVDRFETLDDWKKSDRFKKLMKMFSTQQNRWKDYQYIQYKCRYKQVNGCEAKCRIRKEEGSRSVVLEIPEDQDEPHTHSDEPVEGRKYKKYTPAKGN